MKKILIIEDDPAILTGLQTSLEKENFMVTPVSYGQLGYEKGRSEHFDLILLDIMLPSKNGVDICRDLRKDGIKTPILMLAGPKEKIEKEFGSEVGATDYISKPFGKIGLLAKIKTLLG